LSIEKRSLNARTNNVIVKGEREEGLLSQRGGGGEKEAMKGYWAGRGHRVICRGGKDVRKMQKD